MIFVMSDDFSDDFRVNFGVNFGNEFGDDFVNDLNDGFGTFVIISEISTEFVSISASF